MRIQIVDPSAYTPPYDHALCSALARTGADVELVTSPFAYGAPPTPDGYRVNELFYAHARGGPASRLRLAAKLVEHVPNMLDLRRHAAAAEVVHFQWLAVQPLDRFLLPRRPVVLTAHDLLPREPRPFQLRAQRRLYDAVDAIVDAHSEYGRGQLVDELGLAPDKVRVIHHGAFDYLARVPSPRLPPELGDGERPVVLFFGLLRPYKGIEVLLQAWRALAGRAELWVVGRPRMDLDRLRSAAPAGVRWVPRFVSEAELAACFRRAEIVVLPYLRTERFDFSGVLASALAFGKPSVISDVGGFSELAQTGAAELVAPGDPEALASGLASLLDEPQRRARMARRAREAAEGPYSWSRAAELTVELYRQLI